VINLDVVWAEVVVIIVMIVEEGEDGAITVVVVVVVVIGAVEADPVEIGVEYTFTPMKKKGNGWSNVGANVGHVNHCLM
jgi:hypothetical protein